MHGDACEGHEASANMLARGRLHYGAEQNSRTPNFGL
jgi:hypothetical protein